MTDTATTTAMTTESKTTKGKGPKKTAKAKSTAKKRTPTKAAKPKREQKPKEENLMVFAFRLSRPESERLHLAAGPANASRTMRALAAAFAAEDRTAFESIIEDARKLRT
jgi:hypothetical protein